MARLHRHGWRLAMAWGSSAHVPVVTCAMAGMALACGFTDAQERQPAVRPYGGRLVRTRLSDAELARQGMEIIHRFKSVDDLVYARNLPSGIPASLFDVDDAMTRLFQTHSKSGFVARMGRSGSPFTAMLPLDPSKLSALSGSVSSAASRDGRDLSGLLPQTYQFPFEEGGFAAAQAAIAQGLRLNGAQRGIARVKVAIIDSGVVPVTGPLKSSVVGDTNLTTDRDPRNWQPHATAIASVYAGRFEGGRTENAYAPNAELVSIKISFQGDSEESLREDFGTLQLAIAIDEAVAQGARVVNMSFSYRDALPQEVADVERYLMARAADAGVVFVAAAGNGDDDLDARPVLPANYNLSNVLSVGSHALDLRKAWSSNYGAAVDLTACGVSLPLNTPDGEVDTFSGTSFSVPVVGSALALYEGVNPGAKLEDKLRDLFETARPGYVEAESTVSRYGRLDTLAYVRRGLARAGVRIEEPAQDKDISLHRRSHTSAGAPDSAL